MSNKGKDNYWHKYYKIRDTHDWENFSIQSAIFKIKCKKCGITFYDFSQESNYLTCNEVIIKGII